jgi:acetoin utilization deacetylase AcuC-like enzyme
VIVDFDVHHGNGTQDAFYGDPDVLFVSTHQYPFYPGTGARHERGEGAGVGATLNLPLPAGTSGERILERLENEAIPAIRAFAPELILVSAGFDAYENDPIGGLAVTRREFRRFGHRLRSLAEECCGGRIASVLEGGYNVQELPLCIEAYLLGLTGVGERSEPVDPEGDSP